MSGHPSDGRVKQARGFRNLRVAPTTRAIRAALAVSATVLALSGSGVALAGTCVLTAANTVSCDGQFTDDVSNSVPIVDLLPDLTLILGGALPTSVTPGPFVDGLDASWGGDVTVISHADITTDRADGIFQVGTSSATLSNYGVIGTYGGDGYNAVDISAVGDVTVVNGGELFADEGAGYGVTTLTAYSSQGSISIDNQAAGTIVASAIRGDAIGVYAQTRGYAGSMHIYNAGSISVDSFGGSATGLQTLAFGQYADIDITQADSGLIEAYSTYDAAIGIQARVLFGREADLSLDIAGTISATSYASWAFGVIAETHGDLGDVDITLAESGLIEASSGYGMAFGILAESFATLDIDNAGTIRASAADGVAIGVQATTRLAFDTINITLADTGVIDAYSADGAANGAAYGIIADTSGFASDITVDNAGSIYAAAHGGTAIGVYARTSGGGKYSDIVIANSGSISATSQDGWSYGVLADGNGLEASTRVDNDGDITASASGEYGMAIGLSASAYGGVVVHNDGTIGSTSDAGAIGVTVDTDFYAVIFNRGTIEADGGDFSIAIESVGASVDIIVNQGTISGSIWSGDGDDVMYNEGVWNVAGQSDFGMGDDAIFNYGTIAMSDAQLELGYHTVDGNAFYNYGTVTVSGDNSIDMGHGQALTTLVSSLVPSLNPAPFYNYGTIDFGDGAADDTLSILGDLAGDGAIDLDVSGASGASDVLTIDGSVVAGTNTINVNLIDLPSSDFSDIVMVRVTGDSVADSFALGSVGFAEADSFLTLAFGLASAIDASNTGDDVFSLSIEVTGLSDPGVLAASIVPGVQRLMHGQVGTWRQRVGVIDKFDAGAISLWARAFQDRGSFDPEHRTGNLGAGGNFEFDQNNTGAEVGVDFAATDEFSLGLLLAKAKADQDLDGAGIGSSSIDGDTYGLYGTWISPGCFYIDGSYRWMSFTAKLDSVAGPLKADGDAQTFNVEAGYAWTLDNGLQIEPQLQYTWTQVEKSDPLVTASGMTFVADRGESSVGRLGVALRRSFGDAGSGTRWTPYATLSAVREFDGENDFAINDTFTGQTSIHGTSALLELGVTAQTGNWSMYGGLNLQDGGALKGFLGGQLGVRYSFAGSR